MAELQVEVLKIEETINHPNADRLDLATVLGYQVVVGRDQYKVGDHAVYFPVDSILPGNLQSTIFSGSKMKLNKSRVRAARIRGAMSFGLLVDVPKIQGFLETEAKHPIRPGIADISTMNITNRLGVTKYEPPVKGSPQGSNQAQPKKYMHPQFSKYTDIQHGKRVRHGWETYEGPMVLTEKIHGTNFRCGYLPFVPRTRVQKFLSFLTKVTTWNFVPEYEFVYGSHNVQLQDGNPKPGAPAHDNVYKRVVKEFNLKYKIRAGELWYFEIAGWGVQSGYEYGRRGSEIFLRAIDIKIVDGKNPGFLSWDWVYRKAISRGLQAVPALWYGDSPTLETINNILNPPSMGGKAVRSFEDNQTPAEGGVLRPSSEEITNHAGRMLYKFISDEYLLNKSNSDFH